MLLEPKEVNTVDIDRDMDLHEILMEYAYPAITVVSKRKIISDRVNFKDTITIAEMEMYIIGNTTSHIGEEVKSTLWTMKKDTYEAIVARYEQLRQHGNTKALL